MPISIDCSHEVVERGDHGLGSSSKSEISADILERSEEPTIHLHGLYSESGSAHCVAQHYHNNLIMRR
jgi:hypothetical protein